MRKFLATTAIGIAGIGIGFGIAQVGGSGSSSTWTVKEAEAHAIRALDNLECNRTNPGTAAEAWAEANSTQPHGFEIIAECAGVAPR